MAKTASSPLASAPRLTELLASAEPLTLDERRQIVRQAQVLIEQLFVHLPLKRAMHAVEPVQRLHLLDRRLEGFSDRRFHDEMISIFIGLRDLHTNYILPLPFAGKTATLPFRIEACWEGDTRRYLVSGVAEGLDLPPFGLGVEVTHWGGIPIERAVALNGERNAGSNVDARHARGLITLTQRPMGKLAPPEEEWVDVTFLAAGTVHEQRFTWQVIEPPPAPTAATPSPHADPVAGALGLDALTEDVRRAQKLVLAPEAMALERAMADAEAAPAEQLGAVSTMPDVLQFRTVKGPKGKLGYLRIRTFRVKPLDAFIREVLRILALLPEDGLIIDVRGNGGGVIAAGELLLQLFTPREIEPERLHFINTPLTLEATSTPGSGLEPWRESIAESVETGATFSDGLYLAPRYAERCNAIGQRYHGPVALVIDALCYSTTDIFAAGFQDHEIGPVIGTSGNTGAGGANVWDYDDLLEALPAHVKPLPKQASMRVAIRRTTRVGKRAGDVLEDLGVVSEHIHKMTRRDLLEQNVDLIAEAAQLLAKRPRRAIATEVTSRADAIKLALRTTGLDRVDVYVDGRPRHTLDVTDGEHVLSLAVDAAEQPAIDVRGFFEGELAARRKLELGV
jgi:Peptidase family S41